MRHFPATRHFDARENYRDWVAEFDAVTYLSTLELETSDLKDMALFLLTHAARTDPFGDWLDVVAAGTHTKWDRLRGDGRISIELRVAAELLLRFYEILSRPRTPSRWRSRPKASAGHLTDVLAAGIRRAR